jgi:glycosyltransferase involved in cell wall biosynthesis
MSEWLATFCPTVVITDALTIQDYYRQRYGKASVFIPYGAEIGKTEGSETLRALGLEPGRYFLYVSRMEPENHPLEVRQAFETVDTTLKLALIGDAPYAHDYIRRIRDTADRRVAIPGAIYGEGYRELGSHCFAYIHATEVGGTHPALIEAMGRGALVLYRDTSENAEVAGDAGIPFEPAELADKIRAVLEMSEEQREVFRRRATERVRQRYSWDAVTDAYESLLRKLAG